MSHAAGYEMFTSKATLDKAVNSLLGILEGVSLDETINPDEMVYLGAWLNEHRKYQHRHPFTELIPFIADLLIDNDLTKKEIAEITDLCIKLRSNSFYDEITSDLQRLQGIMSGIASDGLVSATELSMMSDWLAEHDHLRTRYPFDEMDALLVSVLRDGKIDPDENKTLLAFLADFSGTPNGVSLPVTPTLGAILAVDPQINFDKSRFCLTGEFRTTREQVEKMIVARGGTVVSSVSKKLTYLVVGAAGNPYWKYTCYGRKIEQTLDARKAGAQTLIIHENDLMDAL